MGVVFGPIESYFSLLAYMYRACAMRPVCLLYFIERRQQHVVSKKSHQSYPRTTTLTSKALYELQSINCGSDFEVVSGLKII